MEDRIRKARGVWRKSTHSGQGSSTCIEVAELSRGLTVRDSTNPSGPRLAFGAQDWHRFMDRVKAPVPRG